MCEIVLLNIILSYHLNSVLNCIMYYLSSILTTNMKLYVDIPGNESTDALPLTCGQRPDLVLATTSKLFILELTVCFETNLLKSRNYKKNRYAYLKENIIDKSN